MVWGLKAAGEPPLRGGDLHLKSQIRGPLRKTEIEPTPFVRKRKLRKEGWLRTVAHWLLG